MATETTAQAGTSWTSFETHPDRYRHWKLRVDPGGQVARLHLAVVEEDGLSDRYALKQNSYDLGVDIELADAVQRVRFEHPGVRVLVLTSAVPRIFCAGANIYMLGQSSHAFKVNFCKFTNETRLALEDLSRGSGVRTIAALNGTAAGGGYELALACDEIHLVDDGNSAVSFPEVPLLGVLPGTGGLTRLVDKRKVRRDLADVFCTIAEGVKGRRAKEWNLVDHVWPKSAFAERVEARIAELLAAPAASPPAHPVLLGPLEPERRPDGLRYSYVGLRWDLQAHTADLLVEGPGPDEPLEPAAMAARGSDLWALRAWRELDDCLLHLRIDLPEVNVVTVRTRGSIGSVLRVDEALAAHREHPFVRELLLLAGRVLRRMDLTAKSFFALIEPGSAFAGTLFELSLAADRSYMLDDPTRPASVALSPLGFGAFPMSHGQSRLAVRFAGDPGRLSALEARAGTPIPAALAAGLGLVTMALDELDFEDQTRIDLEERASLSPDALTGMEASLRFPGPETLETKIFGRLSAWQNWIFQRPNAVGPTGALTNYGQPTRPSFDFRRT
jgi:benzoyl-CoA-dihydrodiol lyase